MGDIGFSRSFDMLEKGREDRLIEMLHRSMAPTSVFTHVTWLMGIMTRLAGVKDMLEFMAWTSEALRERKKVCLTRPKAESLSIQHLCILHHNSEEEGEVNIIILELWPIRFR